MIIVLKPNCPEEQVKKFTDSLTQEYNVKVNTWVGTQSTVLGLLGDTTSIDIDYIAAQDFVESVKRVQEPYKKANRKFHPDNTVITLPTGQKIGDGSLALIAGPCSVESRGPDLRSGRARKGRRRNLPARRRVQAQNLALFLPGLAGRGPGASEKGQGKDRAPDCDGDHEHRASRHCSRKRGHHPGRRAQHAELRASEGAGQDQTSPSCSKRGLVQHDRRTPDERRVHHGWRQRAASFSASAASAPMKPTPATRWTSLPCRSSRSCPICPSSSIPSHASGISMAGRAAGYGRCGGRCRRPDHRGAQRPRTSPVRRRAVPHPGPIRPCGSSCAPHKGRPLQIERIIPSEGRPANEGFPGRQASGLAGQRSYPLLVNLDGASNFCYTNAVQHRTTAAKAPFASCSWSFSRAGKRRFCGKRRMDS